MTRRSRSGLVEEAAGAGQEEDAQNRELLDLSNQILALTKEVHAAAQLNGRPVQPSSKTTT